MALNDSKLRSIKPTGKVQKISDGGGLYVHVTEKGTMLWRMAYRYGGKQKTLSFGSYPEIRLSSARLLREQARQQLAQGVDPGVVKKEKKEQARADTNKPAGMTFEEVAREWYDIKKGEWSEKNVKVVMWRLQKYVFPEIGGMPISELRTAHVLAQDRARLHSARDFRLD